MILAADDKDFICKNCKYKQHQCFVCGKLGSSDLSSEAEVGMAESYFLKSLKLIYFERFDEMALRLGKKRRKEHFLLVLEKNAQVSQDAPEWTYAQNARNSVTGMAACSHLNILNSFCFCLTRQVFQREANDCGRIYHPKCVAKVLYPTVQSDGQVGLAC
jgi:hypothetical protein